MQGAIKKKTAMVATAAAVGFSSLFMATPANAAPITCSQGATLLTGNICELRVTTVGQSTFTPSAEMSQLEGLLVAGGGSGVPDQGYGSASGGGGEVKVVGFGTDRSTPITLVVGDSGQSSSATQGAVVSYSAAPGSSGTVSNSTPSGTFGGTSGNGNVGSIYSGSASTSGWSGGGAGASPANTFDGGVGVSVASVSPSGSLFSNVTDCYGGGGASGIFNGTIGVADCNAGHVVSGAAEVTPVAPLPNSGGGGTGSGAGASTALRAGASGLVVLRWAVLDVTVTFASNGHGGSVVSQTFPAGGTVTPPAAPTETGFTFTGWFSDAALTTPADFSAPITAATTFYAAWSAVVPVTVSFDSGLGSSIAPQVIFPGGTLARPADPSRAGFTFTGWFSDAALTTPADFTAPVTAATTFYAAWTAVVVPPVTPVVPPVTPVVPPVTPVVPPVTPVVPPVTPVVPPVTTVAPSVTPAPARVAPAVVTADPVLAMTGRAIDPSALSSGLAALVFGIGLLVLKARRARKTS